MSSTKKTIGIFASAAALKEGEQEYLEAGTALLEAKGYTVKFARNINSRVEIFEGADYYLAGTNNERLNSFHEIYQDPEVDILLGLRGGYGSIYLLPELNYQIIHDNPKPICGYSDLTALFMGIISQAKIKCFHMPMLVELSRLNEESLDSFFNMLSICENFNLEIKNKKIIGGNLSLISSLIGTPYLPDLRDAILFIEDCHEEPYKVDRLINHLYLAGVFDQIQELWIGEPEGTKFNMKSLEKISKDKNFKITPGLKLGHSQTKLSITIG